MSKIFGHILPQTELEPLERLEKLYIKPNSPPFRRHELVLSSEFAHKLHA